MATLSKIRPCLWFNDQGEEAAKLYCSIFPNSKITAVTRYVAEGKEIHQHEPGTVQTVQFELNGQPFMALNGGPMFTFSEAVSFEVICETQDELDYYWGKLSHDPENEVCGWCKDKFGVSWQIVPAVMDGMFIHGSEAARNRVMHVVMASKKLNVAQLEEAYRG